MEWKPNWQHFAQLKFALSCEPSRPMKTRRFLDNERGVAYLPGVFRFANRAWIASACAVLFALFSMQVIVAQAEHAGLITCASHAAQNGSEGEKSSSPVTPCGHCHCPQVGEFSISTLECVLVIPEGSGKFFHGDEACPDGPVRSIDYPPQLA